MSSPLVANSAARKPQRTFAQSSNGSPGLPSDNMRRSSPITPNNHPHSPGNGLHSAPLPPSGAEGLERILTKLTDHLANVERRIGRLEQSNYDTPSSHESIQQSNFSQSPRRPSETSRGAPNQNHTFRQPMPPPTNYNTQSSSSSANNYLDASRYRHSMLYALSQSEELIIRLVEDNNRLRRRLENAHREINRVRYFTSFYFSTSGFIPPLRLWITQFPYCFCTCFSCLRQPLGYYYLFIINLRFFFRAIFVRGA